MYALMALIFVLGYLCIALEHPLKIDKAASALLTAVFAWTLLVLGADSILPLLQSNPGGDSKTTPADSKADATGELKDEPTFDLKPSPARGGK